MKSPPPRLPDPLEYRQCQLRFFEKVVPFSDEDPSRFVQDWRGFIQWADPDGDAEAVCLGAFSVFFVDVLGADLEGAAPFDVFDTHQATFDVFQSLFEPDTFELLEEAEELAFHDEFPALEGVLIVNQLAVLPAHRGHDVGLVALKTLIEQFRARATVVVLKAAPLKVLTAATSPQEELIPRAELVLDTFGGSRQVAVSKLKKHFGRLGFAPVPHTLYMVLDAARRMPAYDVLTQNPRPEGRPRPADGRPKLAAISKPKRRE
jgi:GNAT superfamily N-acetyltransferase